MMKSPIALFAAAVAAIAEPAAAGTITLSYSGAPAGQAVTLSAAATISDADAAKLLTWCAAVNATSDPTACFKDLANGLAGSITQQVRDWQAEQAALAAASAVAPIVITPQ